jgi:hypothetical protein
MPLGSYVPDFQLKTNFVAYRINFPVSLHVELQPGMYRLACSKLLGRKNVPFVPFHC